MKLTKEIARKHGFNWTEEIEGKEYMLNITLDPHYTLDGETSYFSAVLIGSEIEDEDDIETIFVGYPRRDEVPEEPNEWDDIYDSDAPFVY